MKPDKVNKWANRMGLVLTNDKGEIQSASLSEEEKVEEAAFNSAKENAKPEETETSESETKETETESEAEAEEEAEVELVEDEQNEDESEEEAEEDEESSEVKTVPIWRFKKLEKRIKNELASEYGVKIAELEKANADLQAKAQAGELSSSKDIEEFAAKHQLDKGFVSELSQLLLSRVPKGNPELEKQVRELQETKKELERQTVINRQYTGYEEDFNTNVLPLLGQDKVSPDRVLEVKNKLRDLALHNPKFTNTPLDVLYFSLDRIAPLSVKRKTAESSKTSVQMESNFVDFESMTAEQVAKLSSEDFAKYDDFMTKKDELKQGITRLKR